MHFNIAILTGIIFVSLTFQVIQCEENANQNSSNLVKNMNFKLHNGDLMPLIGFGTYQVQGDELIKEVMDLAFSAGYRLIDSATVYGNEVSIGKALKELLPKHNLTRKEIFITSKLAPTDQGEKAYVALERSLRNLDCDYIDLYLIHWPGVQGIRGQERNNSLLRQESWKQLVRGVRAGLTRNIGVSNYNLKHMKELLANDFGVKPAVDQVEWHPAYHQPELLQLLRKEGILLQAYSSLGGSNNTDFLINKPEVTRIAAKLGKSPAQVLLRWAIQQNIAVIPKARSKKHIDENIDLDFQISSEDMDILDKFRQVKYAWDPDTIA